MKLVKPLSAADTAGRIVQCIRRHPGWDDMHVTNATRTHIADVRAARESMKHPQSAAYPEIKRRLGKQNGMTREQFLAQYDPMTRLLNSMREAIAMIEPQHYYRDYIMRRHAGVQDMVTWRQLARTDEFRKYQFKLKDEVFWTDPDSAMHEIQNNVNAREV